MKLIIPPTTTTLPQLRPLLLPRSYATHHGSASSSSSSNNTRRRAVTPFNDTGYVPWHQLSAAEKGSRTVQQSFNFGLILVGLSLTGGVAYFLYQDVFSPDSKTAYFNRAVDRIKKDPACLAALGEAKKIKAHGEATSNKWARAGPIASTLKKDAQGNDHLRLRFYVEGPLSNGTVHVYLVKAAGQTDFEYRHLFVDIKGHQRIYLENTEAQSPTTSSKGFKLFGVNWGKP